MVPSPFLARGMQMAREGRTAGTWQRSLRRPRRHKSLNTSRLALKLLAAVAVSLCVVVGFRSAASTRDYGPVVTATPTPAPQRAEVERAVAIDRRGAASAEPEVAPEPGQSSTESELEAVWDGEVVDETQCPSPAHYLFKQGVSHFQLPSGRGRCEIIPRMPHFVEGDYYAFQFEMYLDSGVPTRADWQVLTQWHTELATGSPPVALAVEQWGTDFVLTGGWGHPFGDAGYQISLGPVEREIWIKWVIVVRFSRDASTSTVTVTRDGEPVLDSYHPPTGTLYPSVEQEQSQFGYLKVGYYRSRSINEDASIQHRGWRVYRISTD